MDRHKGGRWQNKILSVASQIYWVGHEKWPDLLDKRCPRPLNKTPSFQHLTLRFLSPPKSNLPLERLTPAPIFLSFFFCSVVCFSGSCISYFFFHWRLSVLLPSTVLGAEHSSRLALEEKKVCVQCSYLWQICTLVKKSALKWWLWVMATEFRML